MGSNKLKLSVAAVAVATAVGGAYSLGHANAAADPAAPGISHMEENQREVFHYQTS